MRTYRPLGLVAGNYSIAPQDMLATKQALHRLGYYDDRGMGIDDLPDDDMFRGIKGFQRHHGLEPDGAIRPGGPTVLALNRALAHPSVSNGGRYDPGQPRDWRGRWTETGSAGAEAGRRSLLHMAAGDDRRDNRDISSDDSEKIVKAAKKWENTPYAADTSPLAGARARNKEGADCSGSTYHIFKEAGLPYNYTPSSQFAQAAETGRIPFREISEGELRSGDVVLYENVRDGRYVGTHMSISTGDGNVYSATRSGGDPYGVYRMKVFHGKRRYYRYQDKRSNL